MTTTIFIVLFIVAAVVAIEARFNIAKANKQAKLETEKLNKKLKEDLIPYFIHQVELADDLYKVYHLHTMIWANGIRNAHIGPNEFGMFRTKDILTMTPGEVYLGNIYGLWTNRLPEWVGHNEESIVLKQYKELLINNLKTIQNGL